MVFIDCQPSPPAAAGLPPMSKGIRVQFVSTAMIFIVSSCLCRLIADCDVRREGQQCLPISGRPPYSARMLRFLVRRLVLAILVCLTVLVVSFTLTRLSGDIAVSIAGPNATAEDVAIIRKNYGFDRPLPVQFVDWAVHAARGDLGRSYLYHASVAGLIRERLPITLTLGLTGLCIALLVSIPLGIVAAMREGTLLDRAISAVALVGQAMPSFWLGLLLDHLVRPALAVAADLRRGPVGRLHHARRGAGLLRHPRADAPDARRHDRGARVRLHPHRARQGTEPGEDRAEARAAQRGDAGGVGGRGATRLHAGRLDRHRGGVCAARRRVFGVGVDQQERFPGGAGGRAAAGADLYRADAVGRHGECVARSAVAGRHDGHRREEQEREGQEKAPSPLVGEGWGEGRLPRSQCGLFPYR